MQSKTEPDNVITNTIFRVDEHIFFGDFSGFGPVLAFIIVDGRKRPSGKSHSTRWQLIQAVLENDPDCIRHSTPGDIFANARCGYID